LEFQPKASPIPRNYPSWASWKSRQVYLPKNFHSAASFDKALSILKNELGDSSILNGLRIDAPLLLLGLIYREVCRAMEIEPGGDTEAPDQLVNSPFGIVEMSKIETLLSEVCLPSSQ
jgi:hypothetical protein